MLRQVISGAQYGADQGGLEAAIFLGLEPGGFVPKGYWTERGALPDALVRRWKLIEHVSRSYDGRTAANVMAADGTVVFGDVSSVGSRLTVKLCKQHNKPYIVNPSPDSLRKWVEDNKIEVMNCAGNRLSRNPGVYDLAFRTIVTAFGGK